MVAVEANMIKVCCVCRKFEQEGQWQAKLVPFWTKVSHVYCPQCFDDFMNAIDRYTVQIYGGSNAPVIASGSLQAV